MKQKDFRKSNFKATLYKNSKTPIMDIPNDFIEEVYLKWNDTNEMTLNIPNLIMKDGNTKENPLYEKIGFLRQEIVTQNPSVRFLISEIPEINEQYYKGENGKLIKYQTKKINCKSYESLCLGKLVLSETISRQLYNDGTTLDTSEGLLDGYFLKDNPYWKIGIVSEKAKKEIGASYKTFYNKLYNNLSFENLETNTVLWENDFEISPFDENSCINIKINYKNTQTINNVTDLEISKADYSHSLDNIYIGISHIKATYMKQDTGEYSICYEITLSDGKILKKYNQFLFVNNMNLNIEEIVFEYTTGEVSNEGVIKYRAFESGEYEWIDFLRNNVASAYGDLYFEFDTFNKILNVYTKKEYGKNKGLNFSYRNYVKSISKKITSDNIISDLLVTSNNTSIASVNPYGNEHIYDYSYFINNGLMSDELLVAWNKYSSLINGKVEQKTQYLDGINEIDRKLIKLESERTALDEENKWLKLRRTDYQANDSNLYADEIKNLSTQINNNLSKFNELTLEIEKLKKQREQLKANTLSIVNLLDIKTAKDNKGNLIFNEDLLEELHRITISKTIQDETYLTAKSLYEYYKEDLKKNNSNYIEFTVDIEGILQNIIIPNGLTWEYYIKLGDYVYLTECDDLINDKSIRIIEYKLLPKDNRITNIVFSNKDETIEKYSGGSTSLSATTSSLKNYNFSFKSIWNESKNVNDFVKNIEDGIDTAVVNIRNKGNRCTYEQTEAGSYFIDGDDENKQLYIGASMICFTQNKWLTSNSALTSEGLNASVIYGTLIAGKQLNIVSDNENGCVFYIGNIKDKIPNKDGLDFGLQIRNNMSANSGNGIEQIFLGIENGVPTFRLNKAGKTSNIQTLSLNEDEEGIPTVNDIEETTVPILSTDGVQVDFNINDSDNLDANEPLVMEVPIEEDVIEIRKAILKVELKNFKSYENGISLGDITGSISFNGTTENTEIEHEHDSIKHDTKEIVTELPTDIKWCKLHNNDKNMDVYLPIVNNSTEEIADKNYLKTSKEIFSHNHNYSIKLDNVTFSQDGKLVKGVFVGEKPTDVSIYVNNVLVQDNINEDISIDVSSYLELNTVNIIEARSKSLGKVKLRLYGKTFNQW